jgi:hypothetical protein
MGLCLFKGRETSSTRQDKPVRTRTTTQTQSVPSEIILAKIIHLGTVRPRPTRQPDGRTTFSVAVHLHATASSRARNPRGTFPEKRKNPRAQRQRSTKPSVRVLCRPPPACRLSIGRPGSARLAKPIETRASLAPKKARHPEGQRARSTRVRTRRL